jgi:hypothetical protein
MVVLALLRAVPLVAGVPEGLDALKRGDYPAAVRELRGPAERGDAEAQYRVGLMYEFGKGYPRDMQQALSWLRRAGTQGHTGAQVELGVLHSGGEGVPANARESVEWFRKAALAGSATGQYNLGLMIAKGEGIARNDAEAMAWFRKAADQGLALAQFTLGVGQENGEGVPRDPVLASASFAIAARNGNPDAPAHRDALLATLTPAERRDAEALVAAWQPGKPMPDRVAAASARAAPASRGPDRCTASGSLEGQAFTATHCALAVLADQHSVAIWFNEDAITPEERDEFAFSAHASETRAGKPRTMITVMFCPGGGAAQASPGAVRAVDVSTSHAKAPMAGIQWVVEAPREVKVERMSGTIEPGGTLAGRIAGSRGKTSFTLDFDVALPTKEAAAGMTCGK